MKGLRSHVLHIYDLKGMPQKRKVGAIRKLFGYKNKKRGKVYHHKGIVDEPGFRKLASNVILSTAEQAFILSDFFSRHDIKARVMRVWLR